MRTKRVIPYIIKQVGFDFPFNFKRDPEKIWALKLPVLKIPIDKLVWHLEIPFWSTDDGFYDLSPRQLMACPNLSVYHYQKVLGANLNLPIDFAIYKGKIKIIDGLHRLTKAEMIGLKEVNARKVPLKKLFEVIGTKNK